MISRKVPVPEGYMGRIIGKGARGLQSLKEETGAQVSTKKGIRDAVFVQGSEKQVKKAEFEIIRKIVIEKINRESGVHKEIRETAIAAQHASGLKLVKQETEESKACFRLNAGPGSPPSGLGKLQQSASRLLTTRRSGATDVWFHLGQLKILDPRSGFDGSIFSEQKAILYLKPEPSSKTFVWPNRFDSFVEEDTFTSIQAHLEHKDDVKKGLSFIRHDVQVYTPSYGERRFRTWEHLDGDRLEGKTTLGMYTGNEVVIGSGMEKVGENKGILFTRLTNQMRGDILLPDLPLDCRLMIQTESRASASESDQQETATLKDVFSGTDVDEMEMRLPPFPRGYTVHFQRSSERTCYNYGHFSVVLSKDREIQSHSGGTPEEKPKYDIRVRNLQLEALFHTKDTPPPEEKSLGDMIGETVDFVKTLIRDSFT
ncbi:uncharacterized protein [Oscarella lobularis]|uniref:uncharacterized protein n=1 Tax=Oscarella lobularis TaxID=121494 RepID=UPI0033134899